MIKVDRCGGGGNEEKAPEKKEESALSFWSREFC
jgi:hypothetical protein